MSKINADLVKMLDAYCVINEILDEENLVAKQQKTNQKTVRDAT